MSDLQHVVPPELGGSFVATSQLMTAEELRRSLLRVAHQISERNGTCEDVVLVGIERGGVPIAQRLSEYLREITNVTVPVHALDVTPYRDDEKAGEGESLIASIADKTVVLVDDVLFTGRTVRAALNTLFEHGRPRCIQLAVVVDRGHREMPIRADFVARNQPTQVGERVRVSLEGGVELGVIQPTVGGI